MGFELLVCAKCKSPDSSYNFEERYNEEEDITKYEHHKCIDIKNKYQNLDYDEIIKIIEKLNIGSYVSWRVLNGPPCKEKLKEYFLKEYKIKLTRKQLNQSMFMWNKFWEDLDYCIEKHISGDTKSEEYDKRIKYIRGETYGSPFNN